MVREVFRILLNKHYPDSPRSHGIMTRRLLIIIIFENFMVAVSADAFYYTLQKYGSF
jgi:hypothetical protein